MELTGHISNGVVVFDGGTPLPEGTRVSVVPRSVEAPRSNYPPLPVVYGGEPGSIHLTNEMIHQILNDEDDRAILEQMNVPS